MLKNLQNLNLPEIEERVLKFWNENAIFEKSLDQRAPRSSKRGSFSTSSKNKTFNFYEGPPYANGRPGIHHILARVFKDIVLRYKSMQGFYVPRRAGWDTHGLPVEIEAEKQLGLKSKKDIEKFGIELFNKKAKEAVWVYKDEWEKMTERIGYWLDLKNAYVTYENSYIESLWWVFSEIAKRGYLAKNYKVVPFCVRCATPLASHELGQPGVYQKVSDPSIYIKFRLKKTSGQSLGTNNYLLVWTTTPWTLPANVAIAVNPQYTYTKFSVARDGKKEFLWSYNVPPQIEGAKIEVIEKISGKKLVGLEYEPLFKVTNPKFNAKKFYKVLGADFVSMEDGTGLVHIAPAFGEDDLNLIKNTHKDFDWHSVPVTVDDAGKVISGLPGAGKFIKEADRDILENLASRGVLYLSGKAEHEYPFCWRCNTPLIYFARVSWFFEVSRLRRELQEENKKINWIPEHIKEGRFGEWIKEAKDWAISRDRYWGTPLPIWECEKCSERLVSGSLRDLEDHKFFRNKFYGLRHTEAEHNLKDVVASGPERGKDISRLTKKGLKDGEKLATSLAKKKIDVIYTSPYSRAKTLAHMFAKTTGAKVISDWRLGEIDAGIFNWRPVKEHKKFFSGPLDEFTKTPPKGENLTDVRKRVNQFIREINEKHQGKNILIVSHGDPLWMLEGAAKNLTNGEILKLSYWETGEVREINLSNMSVNEAGEIDIHRPYVDRVYLKCQKCHAKMKRVPSVADVWYDSGAMPFASNHFPFGGQKKLPEGYPADYICEAIDQTRGWFYTLLAVSTLLGRRASYKNVICLGLILDKHGVKMSKSRGNIVNPVDMIQKYGVDSIRWYFYTVNPPGEPKLFDESEVAKTMRRFLMILYNSYVFYETYAEKSVGVKGQVLRGKEKNVLDRWILARLSETVSISTKHLENYHIGEAAKELEKLLDDLSRWYIRRSRRRLQKPLSREDFLSASATLKTILLEMSKLIAPFVPFFGEALYQSLKDFKMKASVHLVDWPRAGKVDSKLIADMTAIRDIATKALAKRAEAGIKVRQPLGSLRIMNNELGIMGKKELIEILKDEINVKEIVFDQNLKEDLELDTKITAELREEGLLRDLTRAIQELRQKAGYKPQNKVALFIEAGELNKIFEKYEKFIKSEVGAKKIEFKKSEKFDAEMEAKIEDAAIWLGVKKI